MPVGRPDERVPDRREQERAAGDPTQLGDRRPACRGRSGKASEHTAAPNAPSANGSGRGGVGAHERGPGRHVVPGDPRLVDVLVQPDDGPALGRHRVREVAVPTREVEDRPRAGRRERGQESERGEVAGRPEAVEEVVERVVDLGRVEVLRREPVLGRQPVAAAEHRPDAAAAEGEPGRAERLAEREPPERSDPAQRPRADGGREEPHEGAERARRPNLGHHGRHVGAGGHHAVVGDGPPVEPAGPEDGDAVEDRVVGGAPAPEHAAVAGLGVRLADPVEGQGSAARGAAEERGERVEGHGRSGGAAQEPQPPPRRGLKPAQVGRWRGSAT